MYTTKTLSVREGLKNSAVMNGKTPASFPFVDWIRMISMIGIVWAHIPNITARGDYFPKESIYIYPFFMDFWKFGVLCFFMISGFLLAKKIESSNPLEYFQRRVASTIIPYLLVFALTILLFLFKAYILKNPGDYTLVIFIKEILFASPLWFLPNYWICLMTILIFKRYLHKIGFGIILFGLTLAFSASFVYTKEGHPHMYAILAYVFYVWIGYTIGKRDLYTHIKKMNLTYLLIGCLTAYIITSLESCLLTKAGYHEPLSILRISNQIYSVIMFIMMMRLFKNPIKSNLVNPRKETFGIYLYHPIVLRIVSVLFIYLTAHKLLPTPTDVYSYILWFIVKFLSLYAITLVIVKMLLKYNLGFLNYPKPKKT